ncbi:gamma-glutamyltransferase family protein [Ilumatobacter sp.]|uniref:gamma-glutamyltransferase family protein n=1 Tax=Ilumatobacter sp. TaxID=1967498 RepID=UPI003B52B444
MSIVNPPPRSVRAPDHLVASADHLATSAGVATFARGGNALDAAIAVNAAMAVVGPHLCGLGGDLFALVHVEGEVHALNASGRAPAGASAERLRSAGYAQVPFRHHVGSVTIPGCVDGWAALHERFGTLPLSTILAPAIALATHGFPASGPLAASVAALDEQGRVGLDDLASQVGRRGDRVRREGVARALGAIADHGREGFYTGEFGDGLLRLGDGWFEPSDLERSHADWVEPLTAPAFGVDLHTIGPNSQGYLTLGASGLASRLDLPTNPDDPMWAHLLIEASVAAGRDRPAVLHEGADGDALLGAIGGRLGEVDARAASGAVMASGDGDTTYLCTAGRSGRGGPMAVSLIQSNASGFGSHLSEPSTGINLHNRGIGFSLVAGHPAEMAPGSRPPHTLSPALATRDDGDLVAVLGTMGGDAQPQILLQVAARLFHHRESAGRAITAGRWALRGTTGFDTWSETSAPTVMVEGQASESWADGLRDLGHHVERTPTWDSMFGHAHAIVRGRDEIWIGCSDPRTVVGSCAGG